MIYASILMLIAGIFFLFLSFTRTRKIYRFKKLKYHNAWNLLTIMVIGFIVFYLVTAILLYLGYKDLFIPLVGIIFLAGSLFVLFVSDISLKTLSDLINTTASKEELEKKNKDLAQYARLVSHDLKSPLRNIGSFAQILKKQCEEKMEEESKEYLDIIIDSSQNMYTMLEELSVHNKLKIGEKTMVLKPIDLNKIVEEVQFLSQQIIKEKNVKIEVLNTLPIVQGNKAKLTLVFQNLIDNAIKYNRNNLKTIKIKTTNNDDFTKISFDDNGIGIEEKYYDRIFTVFERLHGKSEFSGTGIGLANVTEIMDQFGGKVSVTSTIDKGSSFVLHFPNT